MNKEKENEIIHLYTEKKISCRDIAKALGISRHTISKILKNNQIKLDLIPVYKEEVNLAGLVINSLTVIEKTDKKKWGCRVWRCKCVCGKIKEFSAAQLTKTVRCLQSCGCQKGPKTDYHSHITKEFLVEELFNKNKNRKLISVEQNVSIHIINKKIHQFGIKPKKVYKDTGPVLEGFISGYLIVKSRVEENPTGKVWLCECICGNTIEVCAAILKKKKRKSCGCGGRPQGIVPYTVFSRINNQKKKNIESNLTYEYVCKIYEKQNGICTLSGIPIGFSANYKEFRKHATQTASLDRIDNNIGYLMGNVWWVHKHINFLKSDYSVEYVVETCKAITNFQKNRMFPEYISDNIKKTTGWKGVGDLSKSLWRRINLDATVRNIEVLLSINQAWDIFVKQGGICNLSGQKLSMYQKICNKKLITASLDRIDSSKPYSIENCQWINRDINYMKWKYDQVYFLELCKAVAEYNS